MARSDCANRSPLARLLGQAEKNTDGRPVNRFEEVYEEALQEGDHAPYYQQPLC